jgi:DNA polymerase III subunit epsilon
MLREIVLDTETTGTDAKGGDRVIEIGCVELLNHIRTGKTFHCFVNPQRAVSEGAFAVHGLSDAFLADKPLFADVIDDFLNFCSDARLVIHNAAFDVGFLNMEFSRLKPSAPAPIVLNEVVDTLVLARRRHPGAANNLDALCNRYGIDNTKRTKHGALLDAEILADVYIELLGGKQTSLGLATVSQEQEKVAVIRLENDVDEALPSAPRSTRSRLTKEEQDRHAIFVGTLGASAIWKDYVREDSVD